ncbi:hypothetical protein DL96DRAFT_1279109 [Flagelloscypha sp. PMI_526]|nr:hypothetical protein DL96DRAFT_1279109 [Flagelloscypha sp. PMI_526]
MADASGTPAAGTLQQLSLDVEPQVQPNPSRKFFRYRMRRDGPVSLGLMILSLLAILCILIIFLGGSSVFVFVMAMLCGDGILSHIPSWTLDRHLYWGQEVLQAGAIAGALFTPFSCLFLPLGLWDQLKKKYGPWMFHPLTLDAVAYLLGLACAAAGGAIISVKGKIASPGTVAITYSVGMGVFAMAFAIVWVVVKKIILKR